MKSNRGKQNCQAVNNHSNINNQWVTSTYRVESDQKDLIIKGLRGNQDALVKNETDFHRLTDCYRDLQHKHKMLGDEKINDDREFRMRHEAAVRNIGQLKNEIDALKAELRDKKLEANDLESDETALKQQMDEKIIELENYRNDYKSCIADSEELAGEKEALNNATSKLKDIYAQAQQESRYLRDDNDKVGRKLDELERYHEQLSLQEKILRQKIQGYENENNQLDQAINQNSDALADIELGIKKAQEELSELQKAIAELGMLNEKYKAENGQIQKSIQSEIIKNNNHVKNMKNAEYTHRVRVGQVEEAGKEVKALSEENQSLVGVNYKLAEDLEACRAHLQNLGMVNSKLVEHLQNFSSEDEEVRELINRRQRVELAQTRHAQATSGKGSHAETRMSTGRREYH